MVLQDVPFYSNTSDNLHCYQAVLRMVLKYFLPEKEFSWKKLEKMTAMKNGKWTWPFKGLINLKKIGFDVVRMSAFDYRKFSEEGGKYLIAQYGEEGGKIRIRNSDISQERKLAREFVKIFADKTRAPIIADIKIFLEQGYLVGCNINSCALDGVKGDIGHFVLLFGFDKNNFYLHDPGLPPRKNRKVTFKSFMRAWAYPDKKATSFQAYRFSKIAD